MAFRIAIGDGCCRRAKVRNTKSSGRICELIEANLARMRQLGADVLRGFPEEQEDVQILDGARVQLVTFHEKQENDTDLIIIRAFMPTLKWPTYISFHGIGRVYVDGIVVSRNGSIEEAPRDSLFYYM